MRLPMTRLIDSSITFEAKLFTRKSGALISVGGCIEFCNFRPYRLCSLQNLESNFIVNTRFAVLFRGLIDSIVVGNEVVES